jgi:hypothetical protein
MVGNQERKDMHLFNRRTRDQCLRFDRKQAYTEARRRTTKAASSRLPKKCPEVCAKKGTVIYRFKDRAMSAGLKCSDNSASTSISRAFVNTHPLRLARRSKSVVL